MKRPHFALPEIYDDSLSYYDVLRKLIKSMHVIADNLNKIPEQIANEAKARLLGDQGLQTNIDNEKSAREQADTTLQQNINEEASARKQADKGIKEALSCDISELKSDINGLRSDVNTLNDGGLVLKEDFISTQVNNWLNDHPEATTTVQDKSLEVSKLTDNAKLFLYKDYVTPQMFGAVGDGISDDTNSLQSALDYAVNNKKTLFIPNGIYKTNTLNVNGSVKIIGENSTDNYDDVFTQLECSSILFNIKEACHQIVAKDFKVINKLWKTDNNLIVFNCESVNGIGTSLFDNICARFAKVVWKGYFNDGTRFVNCRTSNVIEALFQYHTDDNVHDIVVQDSYILNCSFSGHSTPCNCFDGYVSGSEINGCFFDYWYKIFAPRAYINSVIFTNNNVNIFYTLTEKAMRNCIVKDNVFQWNNRTSLDKLVTAQTEEQQNYIPAVLNMFAPEGTTDYPMWSYTIFKDNTCIAVDLLYQGYFGNFVGCIIDGNTGYTTRQTEESYYPIRYIGDNKPYYFIQDMSDRNFENPITFNKFFTNIGYYPTRVRYKRQPIYLSETDNLYHTIDGAQVPY